MFKILNLYFWILLTVGCSVNNFNSTSSPIFNYYLSINTPSDKYNTLLRYELNKINKKFNSKMNTLILKASINFFTEETLSLNGLQPLNVMNGVLSYTIIDKNGKIIKTDKLTSKINYGSVSSFYGKDQNSKSVKERIIKRLAIRLHNKFKLIMNKVENKP